MLTNPIFRHLVFISCLLSALQMSGQISSPYLFYNKGAQVCIQPGAILHVQGDLTNANGAGILNNGVINVEGDISNAVSAFSYATSGERTVRLIGNGYLSGSGATGEQRISGLTDSGSLYNLVIDRDATAAIRLAGDIRVDGSLVWNSASVQSGAKVVATYAPLSFPTTLGSASLMQVRTADATYSAPTGGGLLKLYNAPQDADYELYVANGAYNAVEGYQNIGVYSSTGSKAATGRDGYIETRASASAAKGFSRKVTTAGNAMTAVYTFPVGGVTATYNPILIYFKTLTNGGLKLTAKFTDDAAAGLSGGSFYNHFDKGNSTGPASAIDTASQPRNYNTNPGYHVYQADACGTEEWLTMNKASLNGHGYWSFAATPLSGTPVYSYIAETFPHGYTEYPNASPNAMKRVIRQDADGYTSAPAAINFQNQIAQVATPASDLLTYSYTAAHKNFISCDDATGITGGVYTTFSHFGIGSSSGQVGTPLPVTLLYLTATPVDGSYIRLAWSTASEISNKGFHILRSEDGISFADIGWADGQGTTNERQLYIYEDKHVTPGVTYYYKLAQRDINGSRTETSIVSAKISGEAAMQVGDLWPNPTSGPSVITIRTAAHALVHARIYDMLGKLMRSTVYSLEAGSHAINIDTADLGNATYTCVVAIDDDVYTRRMVVMH